MVSPRADSRPYLFGSSAAASRGRRREASSGGTRLPMRRRSGLRGRLVASALCVCLPAAAGWAKVSDKEALVSLYESTGGANWVMSDDAPYDEMLLPGGNHNWNLEEDPCDDRLNMSWHGVSCVDPCYYPIDGYDCAFGRITSLQLQFNNLEGTIPESLFDKLINLTVIDMSHNALSGTIPTTVGKLRNAM